MCGPRGLRELLRAPGIIVANSLLLYAAQRAVGEVLAAFVGFPENQALAERHGLG